MGVVGATHHAQEVLALRHSVGRGLHEIVDVTAFRIDHLLLVDHNIHQAERLGFFSREATAREHQLLGDGVADLAHHKRRYRGWRKA